MALRHTFSPRGGIRPDGSQGRPCVGHFRQGSRRAVAWTARGPRAPRIRRSPGHPRGAARRDRDAGRRQPLRDRRVDRPRRPQGRPDGGQPGRLQPAGRARRDGVGRPGRPDRQAPQPPPAPAPAGRRRPAARAAARSTTPPSSTPASPTAAASPRPRRSSSARTSTRSTGASATPASARSTPPTRRCATATTSIDILPALKDGDSQPCRSCGTGQGGSCFNPGRHPRGWSYIGSTGSDGQPGRQYVQGCIHVPVVLGVSQARQLQVRTLRAPSPSAVTSCPHAEQSWDDGCRRSLWILSADGLSDRRGLPRQGKLALSEPAGGDILAGGEGGD